MPIASKGVICRIRGSSRSMTPSSWYFCSSASSTARAWAPYFVNTSRLRTLLGALAPGERRLVEGDVADQVERVEVLADLLGQRVEDRPSFASSSMTACLRSAAFQRVRNSSRLANRFFERLPREVAQALGDQLAVLVEVLDALGDDRGTATPST